jgi:hypothetical protein
MVNVSEKCCNHLLPGILPSGTPQRGAATPPRAQRSRRPHLHIMRICAASCVDLPAILCYTSDCDPNHDPNVGIVPRRVSGDFTLDCLGGEARQRLWSLIAGKARLAKSSS